MTTETELGFSFDAFAEDRSALLDKASRTVAALDAELGPEAVPSRGDQKALKLLEQMRSETAGFAEFPDVRTFDQGWFQKNGTDVPHGFDELQERFRFYWVRFPVKLLPAASFAFTKLECHIGFNPDVADGRLRPKALLILPDRRFQELLKADIGAGLKLDGSVEAGIGTPKIDLQFGEARVLGKIDAEGGASTTVNLEVGPFNVRMARAEVEHTMPGAAEVFWRLTGKQFSQEDDAGFIVILQVPNEVETVQVSAAMQAYHTPQFGLPLMQALRSFSERVASFFRAGAPISVIKSWDNILPIGSQQ